MSELEFAVVVTRVVWGETEAEPRYQETVKRLKAVLEGRALCLNALKDLSEALLPSTCWAEREAWLAKALLWGLYALHEQQVLTLESASLSSSSASHAQ